MPGLDVVLGTGQRTAHSSVAPAYTAPSHAAARDYCHRGRDGNVLRGLWETLLNYAHVSWGSTAWNEWFVCYCGLGCT